MRTLLISLAVLVLLVTEAKSQDISAIKTVVIFQTEYSSVDGSMKWAEKLVRLQKEFNNPISVFYWIDWQGNAVNKKVAESAVWEQNNVQIKVLKSAYHALRNVCGLFKNDKTFKSAIWKQLIIVTPDGTFDGLDPEEIILRKKALQELKNIGVDIEELVAPEMKDNRLLPPKVILTGTSASKT